MFAIIPATRLIAQIVNAERAGTARFAVARVAIRISGDKTRSVFERYKIISQTDFRDAVRKIEPGRVTQS
jgi:hypothetical protein